jgi:membrane protease YdiL (CAAX protease family)
LGAFALDGVLIVVIAVAGLTVGASLIRTAVPGATSIPLTDQNLPLVLLGQLIDLLSLIAPPFVYPAIGWHSGATPGMRALGLRVVDARSGESLTWGQSLLRTGGWWWSLLTLGAGFVPALATRWRRGLPDWMGSSLVLAVRPLPIGWIPGPYGWAVGPVRPPRPAPLIPAARDATEPQPTRATWTWTDVVPVLISFFPVMFGANWLAEATAQGLRITAGSGGALALSYADEIAVYGASLLLIVLLVRWRRHTTLTALGLRLPAWPWLAAGLPLGFAVYVLEDVGGVIGRIVLPAANTTNQCVGIRGEFGGSLALTLLAVAVIAPISEEIIFRGFTFRWLQGRLPLWAAVLASAAIFSAAHAGWAEPSLFLPVFLGGVLLAYVYAKSRSVWPGVIIHMTINIVGVILILVYSGC